MNDVFRSLKVQGEKLSRLQFSRNQLKWMKNF